MPHRFSRRNLLKNSAVAAAAASLASVSGAPWVLAEPAPGDKLRVAVIGAAGMGAYSVGCALREKLVAMVDVDEKKIADVMSKSVKESAKPKIFHDYRKMLDDCHKDLDVVLIATPDHHHGPAAIRAINYGKHVFCQKPLAHNIFECYALMRAAKEKKVLTQMGNQRYCGEPIRRLAELVAAGAIGQVTETHTLMCRNFGGTGGRPASKPVPAGLHWDEWLGPAALRDYHDGLHPFGWRNWKDFGTGTVGDIACHFVAFPFMALRLWEAKKFSVECLNTTGGSAEKWPQDNIVCFHIPARENMAACKCYVYDHVGLRPEAMKELEKKYGLKWGEDPHTLLVGTKGYMSSQPRIIPESEHQKFAVPPKTLPRAKAGGPIEDLYACIRTGGQPASNFVDASGPLTILSLTSLLAQAAGKGSTIDWDMEKMLCTNKPEINQLVRRQYRSGWEVV